ncbi:hypothetical protein IHV25_04030 [Phaeovibrio sulfidiphilus]|uniref:Flagellar basal body-associated protein FliL n=1 Tax=Phaeovibrio sulfidiphilus TaxID=1220600 RepID=A0A8J6YNV8_9PROT|nr:hypothetical protein [Phaeovibrio sulfidiphilus]MBE1236821.1 hypothetical protein [Phaeovibrio sulfidiphilus]
MKILVVILSVVVLLLGIFVGGIALGFIPDTFGLRGSLGLSDSKAVEAEAPAPPPTPRERLGPPPFLLSVRTLTVPVIVDGRLVRSANISARILVDPAKSNIFLRRGHILSAVFLEELMVLLPQQLELVGHFNMAEIKARLRDVANRALEENVVQEVLISGFSETTGNPPQQ